MARSKSRSRTSSKSFSRSFKQRSGKRQRSIALSARSTKSRHRRKGAGVTVRAGSRTLSLQATPAKRVRMHGKKSHRASNRRRQSELERTAAKMIDQAAKLIKSGIHVGAKTTDEGRQAFKQQANSLITGAARRLNQAVRQGSRLAHRGLQQI